jgi:hypothetical protein
VPIVTLAAAAAVALAHPLPGVVRQGDHVTVSGHVRGASGHLQIVFESERLTATTWSVLARTRVRGRQRFTLRWDVPTTATTGPLSLRVVAFKARRVVAATAPSQSAIGPATVQCAAPVPPAVDIPVGDGWIEGGVILEGGAFPGIDECQSQPYTVTATNAAGRLAATMNVPGGHSYALAPLPAGTYALTSGACRGQATVTAGQGTTANTYCLYP